MASRSLYFALFACSAASGAIAETSAPFGFYIRGDLALERRHLQESHTTFAGRLDFGISPDQLASQLGPFGVHFGLDGVDGPSAADASAFYASVSYTSDWGRFSIGAPRPVIDDGYFDDHMFLSSPIFNLEIDQISRSFLSSVYLYDDTGKDRPIGARWDGVFGDTKLGVSYNTLNDLDLQTWTLAARHEMSETALGYDLAFYGGLESIQVSSDVEYGYHLGIEADSDLISAGLKWDQLDVLYDQVVSAYATYALTSKSYVGLDAKHSTALGGITFYGINGRYNFFWGGWLNVYLGASDTLDEHYYGVGLGHTF